MENMKSLSKRNQQIVYNEIAVQLVDQPDKETRNRKRLEENPLAPWELRVRQFRVFYDVQKETDRVVVIAVGEKEHNTLRIGGEVIQL
jgi:mRNA-degrading endonuclease RelE of RelBE toxin-antitoxin system